MPVELACVLDTATLTLPTEAPKLTEFVTTTAPAKPTTNQSASGVAGFSASAVIVSSWPTVGALDKTRATPPERVAPGAMFTGSVLATGRTAAVDASVTV